MALTFKKTNKPVTLATPQDENPELTKLHKLIETVGTLAPDAEKVAKKIKELKATTKPYDDAVSELADYVATLTDAGLFPADQKIEEATKNFILQAGTVGTARTINDLRKVHEMMGDETFYAVATVPLKDIDAHLILPQRELVLDEHPTKRTIKIIKNPAKR